MTTNKLFGLILFMFLCCTSKKNIEGTYKLTSKNNIHNIILKLNSNKRYSLQTLSTVSGITEGKWEQEKNSIKLIPDRPVVQIIKEGDSAIEVEEYRPFSDLTTIRIKGLKVYFIKKGVINKDFYLEKE